MLRKSLSLLVVSLILAACGGGGGGGSGSTDCGASAAPSGTGGVGSGGPSGSFQISGKLNVEASNKLEAECNNTLATALAMAPGDSFSAQAISNNAGYKGIAARNQVAIHDLYRLTVGAENVRVTLSFSNNNLTANDLDLFLLDSSGTVVTASSEGTDQAVETVTTPGPGTYIVGVRAFAGGSVYLVVAGTTTATTALDRETILPGAEFVPGEVFVKYKSSQSIESLASKHNLTAVSDTVEGVKLMRVAKPTRVEIASAITGEKINAPGHEANEAIGATIEALLNLKRDPNVIYAEPNYIRHASFIPDDPFYKHQWHYPAINLELAWNSATGTNAITGPAIVAVIDTGIKQAHPEFAGQLVPGFDFISGSTNAGDGDGIDPNPEDVGDGARLGESSFHGTHVAGTVAAATNNGTGVAGIAFQGKIMPLRVLGKGGGTDADILQAILFAARLSNSSRTLPAKKADVINMSLGGPNFSNTVQTAIDNARAAGVIVVAAAGNENTNAPSYPAAYDGVISVSAVGLDLKRAPYSNFGTTIDIAAPGGDTSVDRNGDSFADGVLSTLFDDTAGKFSYVFYQGTSMAAPHIAGVLALMRGANPVLTPDTIDQLIAGAHPTYRQRITSDIGVPGKDDLFGHGLIDAKKAVDAAIALSGPQAPVGSILVTSVERLTFDRVTNSLQLNITNGGDQATPLNITSVTATVPWISITITPISGVAPLRVVVTIDRSQIPADGDYVGSIDIVSNATTGNSIKNVPVSVTVQANATLGDAGEIFVLVIDPTKPSDSPDAVVNDTNLPEARPGIGNGYRYAISGIPSGFYLVYAGTDRDNDNLICEIEDACGTFGALVEVTAAVPLTNLNFSVNNAQSPPPPSEVLSLQRSGSTPKKRFKR